MFSTYKVTEVFKDPSTFTIRIGDREVLINSNRNNIAILQFPNDDSSEVITYFLNGDDMTDKIIDDHARNVIQSLNAQEISLASITIGVEKQPSPGIDPIKLQVLADAEKAFAEETRAAQVRSRNDQKEIDAYNDLIAAKDDVEKP